MLPRSLGRETPDEARRSDLARPSSARRRELRLRRSCDGWPTAPRRRCAALGVGGGDTVGLFMPLRPQTAAALLRLLEAGRDRDADLLRLRPGGGRRAGCATADARVLVTVDGFPRRG